jgi:uncharacterized membrane protein HdeD (DUF308 family)
VSEQARTALQEKMKDANKNIWVSLLPVLLGIIFIVNGIFVLTEWHISFQIILLQITIGIACMIIGICMTIPYIRQYNRLKKELENIATSFSNCPNCKKEIPQGNFAFCPFCGNPLKK